VEPRVYNGNAPLHRLYTGAVIQGRREEVQAIIAQLIPRVKDLAILTEGDKPIVHVVFEDHSVPVAIAGDGICSLVRMSLELASRPSGVVLLEEPEVHQHPAAIRCSAKVILAAVRRDIQVILTTHSLELIDSLLAEAVTEDLDKLAIYRLQLDQGILTSRRIPGAEAAFLRTEIENDLR
jgi:predicted ATPase